MLFAHLFGLLLSLTWVFMTDEAVVTPGGQLFGLANPMDAESNVKFTAHPVRTLLRPRFVSHDTNHHYPCLVEGDHSCRCRCTAPCSRLGYVELSAIYNANCLIGELHFGTPCS